MYIPYAAQCIDEEDIKAVTQVLCSDYLTTGPKAAEFEEAVAQYVNADYGVAVANGTAALHIACMAVGLKEGDEVITTPMTFAASVNCILYCGAKPVFADIDPVTYNISPDSIRRCITKRTKAIIAVHYTGQPCDMDEIGKIAGEYDLVVIEDGAHGLGAEYKGKKIGGISRLTCFSFHPVKHITTGEGGMVTTNDSKLYDKLKSLSTHGIVKNCEKFRGYAQGEWYYEQQMLGFNYRITDIQCALGISQLKKLPVFLKRRKEIADIYFCELKDVGDIILPEQGKEGTSSWHLFVIQVPKEKRKKIFDTLRSNNIGVNVHYIPVYKHPYYQAHGYDKICCREAEKLYDGLISLPLYPGLTQLQQEYVIEKLKAANSGC